MTQNTKKVFFCLMAALVTIFILYIVYSTIDKKGSGALTAGKAVEQFKNIETTEKKWLNGYFGLFFRFKNLGNINWVVVPLLIYFFVTIKKRERWQLALVFVWLSTAFFIGLKGYANFRYHFTLVPFTTAIILLLFWEFLKNKKKYMKIFCFSFFTLICLYNVYHYFNVYRFFWDLRVSVKNPHFPYKLVEYLNSKNTMNISKGKSEASNVYVINQPLFYYYTKKKGIDSLGPKAWQANKLFKSRKGGRNRKRVFRILKGKLNCTYVLLKFIEKTIYRDTVLTEFLGCECRLVLKDKGWFLYKLRDQSLENILRSPDFRNIRVWYPGKKLPRDISPPLLKFFQQGQFRFDSEKNRNGNVLVVNSMSPDKDGRRRINFGYEASRKGLKMGIPEGNYVHLIVSAKISPNLMNKDNYIFISDLRASWDPEKAFFTTPGWRTYLISKKVNPGSKRLVLGFRFNPQLSEDKLMIRNVWVYVSEKPL